MRGRFVGVERHRRLSLLNGDIEFASCRVDARQHRMGKSIPVIKFDGTRGRRTSFLKGHRRRIDRPRDNTNEQ